MAAAEQRKAAAPEADSAAPTPEKAAPKAKTVTLRLRHPHVLFDLSAQNLPSVTQEGTVYTIEQADTVLMLAHKLGVPVAVVPTDEEK